MKGNSPLISVVIPCYNQAHFLPEAVASLQAQTIRDWECIIINDGSTDDTSKVAHSFAQRDARIRCVDQANRGLSGARNRGLEEMLGRYVQFLDADDYLMPSKLELQLNALSAENASLAYCNYYFGSPDSILVRSTQFAAMPARLSADEPLLDLALRWETEVSVPIHCFLFDARLFRGIRFDETLPNHEDWDCLMRIFSQRPVIRHIDQELVVYRLHNSSMCRDLPLMRKGFIQAIQKQRRIFRSNEEMHGALTKKLKQVRQVYHQYSLSYRIYNARINWVVRFLKRIKRTLT